MRCEPKAFVLKDGRRAVLRCPRVEDAAGMLACMAATVSETPYLVREPDEAASITIEQEEAFILRQLEDERTLMLLAEVDGAIAGICHLMPVSGMRRMLHRCSLAISLLSAHWGLGLGRAMMTAMLEAAPGLGYEQAELETVTTNERALRLYRSLGFAACGTLPRAMKYADGSYADLCQMIRLL